MWHLMILWILREWAGQNNSETINPKLIPKEKDWTVVPEGAIQEFHEAILN